MLTDEQIKRLPPVARAAALHRPMPRARSRGKLIGIAITILLHLTVVTVLILRGGKAPENIVFLKLFPLPEVKPAASPEHATAPESDKPAEPPAPADAH